MRPLSIKTKLMGKGLEISTVQLGSSDRKAKNKKLHWNFETIVFHRSTDMHEWDGQRYGTAEEARDGHRVLVAKWKAKTRKQIRDELAKIKEAEGG